MTIPESTLLITHNYIKSALKEGDIAIDATMGNGNDTLFMAKLVGESGKVFAFDVQESALINTKDLLSKNNLLHRTELICDGHQNMSVHIRNSVKAVMFNLGYLPGGNHNIGTKSNTTIAAIEASMELLEPGGLISLAVYYGGDSGFDEKNALMDYIKTIDYKEFTVLMHDYINRPNCPPIAVMIEKNKL